MVASLAGGALGGVTTAVLMRLGASANASGITVMLAGSTAAVLTHGKARTFSTSAGGMGLAPILARAMARVSERPPTPPPASTSSAAGASSKPSRNAPRSMLTDEDVYYALRDARNAEYAFAGLGWQLPEAENRSGDDEVFGDFFAPNGSAYEQVQNE